MSIPCELTLANKEKFDNRQLKALVLIHGDGFHGYRFDDGDSMFEEEVEAMYRTRRMEIHSARTVKNPDPPIVIASMPARPVPR